MRVEVLSRVGPGSQHVGLMERISQSLAGRVGVLHLLPFSLRELTAGGAAPDRCDVGTSRPCVWHRIDERADCMGRTSQWAEVLPPLEWPRGGRATWLEVLQKIRDRGYGAAFSSVRGACQARAPSMGSADTPKCGLSPLHAKALSMNKVYTVCVWARHKSL